MSSKGIFFCKCKTLIRTNNSSDELVPPIKLWRQPDYIDIPKIYKLVYPATNKVFGDFKLEELIELSTVSIVMENTLKEVIAYISLKTYPNICSLDPAIWIEWIQFHYGLNKINYENTYFIHLLVWDVRYNYKFLAYILQTIFLDNGKLEYICLLSFPGTPTYVYMGDQIFEQYFTRISPLTCGTSSRTQVLFVCSRSEQLPKLKIRRAVVGDNDDLVEILDKTSTKLRQMYGDYYIAETVLYPQVFRSIIVAESDNVAVGLLCLNSEINIKQLNQHFELGPFHGLKHCSDEMNICSAVDNNPSNFLVEKNEPKHVYKSITIESDNNLTETYEDDLASTLMSDNADKSISSEEALYEPLLLALVETSSSDTLSDSVASYRSLNLIISNKHHDSTITIKTLKEYPGEINAFAIELYGLEQDLDDRKVYDLLSAAFETFVDREYCLITLPTIRKTFPLLQHFVKLVPRPITTINHDLFVLHRNSIISPISVKLVESKDIEQLRKLFNNVQHNRNIIDIIKATLDGYQHINYQSYLMQSNSNVFGVFVLKEYCNYLYLKTNYDLDFHINLSNHKHCELQIFYLSPIFNANLFFIFNEIHRLTGYTSFYFFLYDDLLNQTNLATIISGLMPIRPRRRIIYNDEHLLLDYVKPDSYNDEKDDNKIFSLYHTNIREFSNLKKHIVNARLIIVGMSTTSLSFIEELIYNKLSKTFSISNIILVTPNKYNTFIDHSTDILQLISPVYHKFNRVYMKKINLKTWINIINGFLTKINRYKKYIVINNKYNIKYDYLFMISGLEFYIPSCIKTNEISFLPSNMFIVNTVNDAENAYSKIKDIKQNKFSHHIIIYGESIESYCCIHFLLSIGVKPQNIIFIRPPLSKHKEFYVPVFNDTFVEKKIHETISELNIKVLNNHKLIEWEVNERNYAKKISFETPGQVKSIDCLYCFLYDVKMVNPKIIKAVNRAGLVFDGRLVINTEFETNDPFVFAAGPLTKYRRVLYAEDYRHEYYNSEEVGIRLANIIIDKIDPTKPNSYKKPPKHFPLIVSHFHKPIVVRAVLPGNYNYLYIRAPGLPVPHTAAKLLDDYGVDLYTGLPTLTVQDIENVTNPGYIFEKKLNEINVYKYAGKECDRIGYFRLHLNEYNFVHTIVCLTKNSIDTTNIIELWGKHEIMLHNLLARYKNNLIDDFYEYFRENWATIIYHDRFHLLTKLNEKIMFNGNNEYDQLKLLRKISNCIIENEWEKLNAYQRQSYITNFSSSKYKKIVEKNLLIFLKDYHDELPMYADADDIQKIC